MRIKTEITFDISVKRLLWRALQPFMGIIAVFFLSSQETWASKTLQHQLESYLNGIKTLVSDFVQTNPNGENVYGKIWLKRSRESIGKMRLDYESKVGQRIISCGNDFVIYDLNEGTESHYAVESTPAVFILQQAISFQKDLEVIDLETKENTATLTLAHKNGGGTLALTFSLYLHGDVKGLEKWVVIDAQGNKTTVDLISSTVHINDRSLTPDSLFKAPPKENS